MRKAQGASRKPILALERKLLPHASKPPRPLERKHPVADGGAVLRQLKLAARRFASTDDELAIPRDEYEHE